MPPRVCFLVLALAGCRASAAGEDGSETAGSTTAGDGSTTTTDEGTSADFIPPRPDLGGAPACDIFDPESCPPGEKCTAYSLQGQYFDRHGCFPVMGDGQPDDPCTAFGDKPGMSGLDDCAKGSMCWNVDAVTHEGYCIDFCVESPSGEPVCNAGYTCPLSDTAILALCLHTCNPVLAATDCLGMKETCVYANPVSPTVPFACVPVGENAGHGEPCMNINSCAPGLFCGVAADVPGCATSHCCSEFCDLMAPDTCAGQGQICEPWVYDGMVPPGYEHVGGCGLP